jgi:hypothetical protein
MSKATTAVYVYGVVRAAKRPAVSRMPSGVPGAGAVETLALAPSLWLAAARVPLDLYGPAQLEPRLADLDWVAGAAVAHEAVVERFAKSKGATVIPMKLFTMFSSVETAVRDVASRQRSIREAMRRIAGAEEWGIRVFRQAPDGRDRRPATRAASGAEFLRARKQARDATAAARSVAAAAADAAFDRLRRIARDARLRDARSEPGLTPPLIDAALLVPVRARARFTAEARRQAAALGRAGAELVVSGPWPAYNFVTPGERA